MFPAAVTAMRASGADRTVIGAFSLVRWVWGRTDAAKSSRPRAGSPPLPLAPLGKHIEAMSPRPALALLPGTLELLVLRALRWEPTHGTGIGNNEGAGRAAFLPWGNLNIKGVGRTPLAKPERWAYSVVMAPPCLTSSVLP